MENPNYGRFTLATLKRLVPVFDVALMVKYVPFSEYVEWLASLAPEDLAVPGYEHDAGLLAQSAVPLSGHSESSSAQIPAIRKAPPDGNRLSVATSTPPVVPPPEAPTAQRIDFYVTASPPMRRSA